MQKARRHTNKSVLRPLVSVWFQVLFTPLLGVLFTFPSRYWFTIGLSVVFSLSGWCRQIQTGFHRSRPTQDTSHHNNLTCTGLSPPTVLLSRKVPLQLLSFLEVLQPRTAHVHAVWATPRSLATTCGITNCFLLLQVLRCFSSPGFQVLRLTRSSTW